MLIFISELVGTFLLILIGEGVVANVCLNKSGMKGAGTTQITLAWGFAVLIPCFIFGTASGAHFNPALTIALVADGTVKASLLPQYIGGQLIGGFLGAALVALMFHDQFKATEDQATKLGVFCTAPSVPNTFLNLLSEIVETFILVFAIKGIGNVTSIAAGVDKIFVFAIIVSIGMSFGGLTGYAINPARDFAPRLAHQLLPIPGKGTSNWSYAWIPIVGPIIGGLLAVGLYAIIPW